MYPNTHCSSVYNGQDMEAVYTSTDRCMDKDVVQIYDGIVFRNKKEWNNAICSKMDGLRDYHTESDRQRHMLSLIFVIQKKKKNDTHQLIYKMEINSQTWIMNFQSWGRGRWGWRTVWEFGIDICQGLTLDTMQVVSNSLQPPWTVACQASLSLTISQSLPKFPSIESVMPSSHRILCHPLLLLPSIFPIIRVFFQWASCSHQVAKALELQLQHQSFHEYSGLISFKTDWLELLAVQGTLKSLLQHHSLKASGFWRSAVFMVLLSRPYMTTGIMTIVSPIHTFVSKVMSLLFNTLSRFVIPSLPSRLPIS